MRVLLLILFLTFSFVSRSQETFPSNGAKDSHQTIYAVTNATLHVDAFTVYNDATLLFKNGKVIGVNESVPSGAVIIDAKGNHIYPSFIDLYTSMGCP